MKVEPEVGIFWIWEGQLFHLESVPLSQSVQSELSCDYAIGHYAAWRIMAKNWKLQELPLQLQDEYDSIPRGRVIYLKAKKLFIIYHGDDFNDSVRKDLIEQLHLPKDEVIDEVDEHYNPLPEDFQF